MCSTLASGNTVRSQSFSQERPGLVSALCPLPGQEPPASTFPQTPCVNQYPQARGPGHTCPPAGSLLQRERLTGSRQSLQHLGERGNGPVPCLLPAPPPTRASLGVISSDRVSGACPVPSTRGWAGGLARCLRGPLRGMDPHPLLSAVNSQPVRF